MQGLDIYTKEERLIKKLSEELQCAYETIDRIMLDINRLGTIAETSFDDLEKRDLEKRLHLIFGTCRVIANCYGSGREQE